MEEEKRIIKQKEQKIKEELGTELECPICMQIFH